MIPLLNPGLYTFCRLLSDAVLNFQNNQEEITLIVNPERVNFKNYVEDAPGEFCEVILYVSERH